jgi:hypothetical protein
MNGTFFASLAVLAYIVITAWNHRGQGQSKTASPMKSVSQTKAESVISALLAGVIGGNGLFHFLHGILNYQDFPAPFAAMLDGGFITDVLNVLWGLFCLTMSYSLIRRYRRIKTIASGQFGLVYLVGLIGISLLLRFVLLSTYFSMHAF